MFKNKKIIDLTLELYEGMQSWDIHPKVALIDYHRWWLNKDRYEGDCNGFSTKLMTMTDHTGTHVDSQTHFFPDGKSIEEYSLEKFCGQAVLIDISSRDINQAITVDMLERALDSVDEDILEDDILVVKAWALDRDHETFPVSPGFTSEVADWLIEKKIKLLATDLATVDYQDMSRPVHVELLKRNILIIENLVNLDNINKPRFDFIGFPLKLKEATGSPIRAVAMV